MKLRFILLVIIALILAGCGPSSDTHEYLLQGKVAEVIRCDKEAYICEAHVFKGPKRKYNEIWRIAGEPKAGDKVYRVCRFKIAPQQGKDSAKSAGLSSRSKIEKTLDNNNCDETAFIY